MEKTKVFYSIQNAGDGSAYPIWFDSLKLCEFHQELESEEGNGWGEPCVGWLTIEHDGPIFIKDNIGTVFSLLEEAKEPLEWYKEGSKYRPAVEKKIKKIEKFIEDNY